MTTDEWEGQQQQEQQEGRGFTTLPFELRTRIVKEACRALRDSDDAVALPKSGLNLVNREWHEAASPVVWDRLYLSRKPDRWRPLLLYAMTNLVPHYAKWFRSLTFQLSYDSHPPLRAIRMEEEKLEEDLETAPESDLSAQEREYYRTVAQVLGGQHRWTPQSQFRAHCLILKEATAVEEVEMEIMAAWELRRVPWEGRDQWPPHFPPSIRSLSLTPYGGERIWARELAAILAQLPRLRLLEAVGLLVDDPSDEVINGSLAGVKELQEVTILSSAGFIPIVPLSWISVIADLTLQVVPSDMDNVCRLVHASRNTISSLCLLENTDPGAGGRVPQREVRRWPAGVPVPVCPRLVDIEAPAIMFGFPLAENFARASSLEYIHLYILHGRPELSTFGLEQLHEIVAAHERSLCLFKITIDPRSTNTNQSDMDQHFEGVLELCRAKGITCTVCLGERDEHGDGEVPG